MKDGHIKANNGFRTDTDLASSAGRKGGAKTLALHGIEHFQEIGRKGGQRILDERGREFFAEIGRKGGKNKAANRGHGTPSA